MIRFRHEVIHRAIAVACLTLLCSAARLAAQRPTNDAREDDRAEMRRDPFALIAHVGLGRFPALQLSAVRGPASARIYLLGGGVEMRAAPRLFLDFSATVGFHLGACADWCPGSGANTDLSALWLVHRLPNRWGVLLGPTLSRSTIAGDRMGGGATASVGAVSGIGPRFTVRYVALSGPNYNQGLSALLSLRLGGF
ncbi:MAG TPA: hypothetical protein VGE27_17235 [Gemmatimonas sp.]|uniref:hypothetical protein n=1 Tax=Gemmatimonas sp. TaxID=1962908 RepID=UPI002ED78F3C